MPPCAPRPDRSGRTGVARSVERPDEGGFVLLESLIEITLLTIIMAALTTFFVTATDSTSSERTRQSAVLVADTEMDLVRSVEAADLPLGRSNPVATAQFATAPSDVLPWLTEMDPATDPTSASMTLPMSSTSTIAGTTYTMTDYLGWCNVLPSSPVATTCTNTVAAKLTGTQYLRVVVAVTWSVAGCPAGKCTFVDATLVSTADDPVFTLGQAPPQAPIITNPGNQTSAVNDNVGLQMSTSVRPGRAVHVAGGQPARRPHDEHLRSHQRNPTTTTAGNTVVVTVTDAFLRTATATFQWTVVPDLVANFSRDHRRAS